MYTACSRTNYFKVADEKQYQELFSKLISENTIKDFSKEENNQIYHSFGSYAPINYNCEDSKSNNNLEVIDTGNIYDFALALQPILPDNEMFIYQENGNFELEELESILLLATNKKIIHTSIQDLLEIKQKELKCKKE